MAPPESSFLTPGASPANSKTPELWENDLKCNLIKMIEAFKEEMNKVLKEIQENTTKQVKALTEEENEYKEIQGNTYR